MPWLLAIRGPHDSVEIMVYLSFGKQLPTLLGKSRLQRLEGAPFGTCANLPTVTGTSN